MAGFTSRSAPRAIFAAKGIAAAPRSSVTPLTDRTSASSRAGSGTPSGSRSTRRPARCGRRSTSGIGATVAPRQTSSPWRARAPTTAGLTATLKGVWSHPILSFAARGTAATSRSPRLNFRRTRHRWGSPSIQGRSFRPRTEGTSSSPSMAPVLSFRRPATRSCGSFMPPAGGSESRTSRRVGARAIGYGAARSTCSSGAMAHSTFQTITAGVCSASPLCRDPTGSDCARPPVDPALVLMSRSMLALRRPFAATLLVALFAVGLVSCALIAQVASPVPPHGEWPTHGGTNANARYSSLDQITRDNVRQLRIAWRWTSPDHELMALQTGIQTWLNQATPLMIGGVLYVSTSVSQVAAIEAISGRTLWVHDPKVWVHGTPANFGYVHRGVAHWTDGRDARILIGTGNAYLIALDARTGTPVTSFGVVEGADLTEGLGRPVDRRWYTVTSPPLVIGDLVIVGSSIQGWPMRLDMPPGHVRAFDVRTGTQRWIFHSIPQVGQFGNETWAGESWRTVGGVNVWTIMSADEELGYVYLPFSPAANDYYGGERHGDNLFADSLVCLEAATGRRVWHFQFVRHGLWDYDIPAAPNLVDVIVGGRRVSAVAQVTKQGFVFVFDRVTGRPLWPIDDRPVPQFAVPGEKTAPRQPFPTRPAPFERQEASPADVIDLTPELREQALEILARYD